MKTKLILVGGFLGAGKTSLLVEAAKELQRRYNVGLISNDQADELVDTHLFKAGNIPVREVSGSCFCCNFNGFWSAVNSLCQDRCDIILAEPVGSCTDLSATLGQPLKADYSDKVDLAPLSVLADPHRLEALLDGALATSAYIRLKQLEEADAILITKADLLTTQERRELYGKTSSAFPGTRIFELSSLTGEGLDVWLDWVLTAKESGGRIAEVDYDIYAAGEAAYGWLNATYALSGPAGKDEAVRLLDKLSEAFERQGMEVGHVKFLLQGEGVLTAGNLTGTSNTKTLRSFLARAAEPVLTINARAETSPDVLEEIVREAVKQAFDRGYKLKKMNTLIPGRPNPTYRYPKLFVK